jgi:hypothetical protein
MKLFAKIKFLRKVTGTTDITKTLKKAVETLANGNIPSIVVGGVAVQEYGYLRMTVNVDLIVPNVKEARDYLSIRGFKPNPGSNMTVTDRDTKIEVNLLLGGGSVGPGPLKLPIPKKVSRQPHILELNSLIAIKLSSYIGNKFNRAKDLADVVELTKINKLSKALKLPKEVQSTYLEIWEGLQNEDKA